MKNTSKLIHSLILTLSFLNAKSQSPVFDWAAQMGGYEYDQAFTVLADKEGNVYTLGVFQSQADFDPGPSIYQLTSKGVFDVVVTKLDARGNFIWARSVGGTGNDYASRMDMDDSGDLLITGIFEGTVDFDPGPGLNNFTSFGQADVFILKLNASGNFAWARQIGGAEYDVIANIKQSPSGEIYLTGGFWGTVDFDPGIQQYELTSTGYDDAFIAKLDRNGKFIWVRQLKGPKSDVAISVVFGRKGDLYITGRFEDTVDFDPADLGEMRMSSANPGGVFLLNLDKDGQFSWVKTFSSSLASGVGGLMTDKVGDLYLWAHFQGVLDCDPGTGVYQMDLDEQMDIVLIKLDGSGNFIRAGRLHSEDNDNLFSMAMDSFSNLYLTGGFMNKMDVDPGSNVYNITPYSNQWSVYIVRLDSSLGFGWAGSLSGENAAFGKGIASDIFGNILVTGSFLGKLDMDPGADTSFLPGIPGQENIFIQKMNQCGMLIPDKRIERAGKGIVSRQIGVSYQWIDCLNGNKPIKNENKQLFMPKTNGQYAVIISYGTCPDTSACLKVNDLDIDGTVYGNHFSVFPNPGAGMFYIDGMHPEEIHTIRVYNPTGSLISMFTANSSICTIDLSSEPAGIYTLLIHKNGEHFIDAIRVSKL